MSIEQWIQEEGERLERLAKDQFGENWSLEIALNHGSFAQLTKHDSVRPSNTGELRLPKEDSEVALGHQI